MMEKNYILAKISENVRRERLSQKYSQEKLAEKAGITQKYLNMIENTKANPSSVVIANLCEALDIDANTIFNFSE